MAKANPKLEDLEGANNDAAPPAIPPGVDAKVRIDYTTRMDPVNESPRARRFNDELYDLAAETEDEDPAHPVAVTLDPLSQFCLDWRLYAGHLMKVTRLPDSGTRRMPGQTYNRTCLEIESLGSVPFDPANLENTLQLINGNSGGVFRFFLVDSEGYPVEHEGVPARVDRVAIGDPPKFGRERERYNADPASDYSPHGYPRQPAPTPAPPQKSELEQRMERIQSDLFESVLKRALDPPPPPTPPTTDPLSAEDRVGLYILNNGGLIPALMEKMTAIAGAPEAVGKETWQERALTAGLNIAQNNPQLIERVSQTIYAIVDRILPNTRTPVTVAPNVQAPPIQHPPGVRANTPLAAPAPSAQPAAWDNPDHDSETDNDPIDDDPEIMDIIEQVFNLLTDTRPFTVNDPVFVELAQKYPQKFGGALQMIASTPIDMVIEWIKTQGDLYDTLLTSPATAAHYRRRLEELQTFCKTPPPAPTSLRQDPLIGSDAALVDNEANADNHETR